MKKLRLGILGASSLLAKDVIAWLVKWHFPYEDLYLYDTKEYCGTIVACRDTYLSIQEVAASKFEQIEILFICEEEVYVQFRKQIPQSCYVINMTQYYQGEMLILPQVSLKGLHRKQMHFWIPSASLCTMLILLSIAKKYKKIQRVDAVSMHSAGELGLRGHLELQQQIFAYAKQQELEANVFPIPTSTQHLPLLFQVLPQTSKMLVSGETMEEEQLRNLICEYLKEDIEIFPTCVRIASMRGLALSLHISFKEPIQLESIIDAYASSSSCICFDDEEHTMYPILADVLHDHHIYIGRMRASSENDFCAWAVCDDQSIRCAAAIQTAFYLYHNFFNE